MKRLEKIKEILEKEYLSEGEALEDSMISFKEDGTTIDMIFFLGEIIFSIDTETGRLGISFYSSTPPDSAALYIKNLYENNVTDFDIWENVFPSLKNGKCEGLLFGDEAEERWREAVCEEMSQNIKGIKNNTTH